MRNERTKAILDAEELAIQKMINRSIVLGKTDLWPSVQKEILRECMGNTKKMKRVSSVSKRVWIPAAALTVTLCLLGAGVLTHWFIYDSNGHMTVLTENDGFKTGSENAAIMPSMDPEASGTLFHPYDWADDPAYIPGGLQIPGHSAEERNIPKLKEKLGKLQPASYAEIRINGMFYTAVQGSFTTDYETCKKTVSNNVLGIRLPDDSLIPADYSERLSFTIGYFLTEKDYASRKTLSEEETEQYMLRSCRLPETVDQQVGWYVLEWFKPDKSPIICTAHLSGTDEWYIPTTDEKDIVKPLSVDGFAKALYWERHNETYDDQEISVMLWQKMDPVDVMETGYTSQPDIAERRYIVYTLDTVGISGEDAVKIAKSL